MPSSGKVFTPKQGNPRGYKAALLYEKPEGGFWNFALPDSFLCNCTACGVGRKSRNCQGDISPWTWSELWVRYPNTTDKARGTQTPESTLSCVWAWEVWFRCSWRWCDISDVWDLPLHSEAFKGGLHNTEPWKVTHWSGLKSSIEEYSPRASYALGTWCKLK